MGAANRASIARVMVAVAVVLAAPDVRATSEVGNLFGGPTEAGAGSSWLNPAALTLAHGTNVWVEGGLVFIGGTYDRAGLDPATGQSFARADLSARKPELAAAFSTDAADRRLRLALGFTVPFVDGARWPEKMTTPTGGSVLGPTVYHGYDATSASFFITPTVAYEITPRLQIGGGINVIATTVELHFYKDFGAQLDAMLGQNLFTPEDPQLAAPATLEARGWSLGFALGLTMTPVDGVRIGVDYVSASDADLDTHVAIGDAPALTQIRQELRSKMLDLALRSTGTLSWHIPQTAHAGLSITPRAKLQLAFDFQWSDASSASFAYLRMTQRTSNLIPEAATSAQVRTDDYRVGGRVVYGWRPELRTVLRLQYDRDAVPEQYMKPTNLGFDIFSVGLGAEWALRTNLRLVADYTHFFVFDRDVQTSAFRQGPDVVDAFNLPPTTGHYGATANRVGMSLRWQL
ncbi:MAG TPA: outer membrane protein transport protein [Polyangia bacterium]|nr:outer membrane protein transport protein [Polyangia bacterium]